MFRSIISVCAREELHQAKVKELARVYEEIEELAKLNAAGDDSLYQSQND